MTSILKDIVRAWTGRAAGRRRKRHTSMAAAEVFEDRVLLSAVVFGDFNGDGYSDMAVGMPDYQFGPQDAGIVQVVYGTSGGLDAEINPDAQLWFQGKGDVDGNVQDTPEADDRFGESLAVGDFNNDGFDDLAIGVPGEDNGAGAVQVLYGYAQGLTPVFNRIFRQGSDGIQGVAEAGDEFGKSLAAGDFDGDGYDDLAVGVPYEYVIGNTVPRAGAVNVIYGGWLFGLNQNGNQLWYEGYNGLIGQPQPYEFFGIALTAGDFNGDGADDLAVGASGEDITYFGQLETDAGQVHVIYGLNGSGLVSASNEVLHQGSAGVPGVPEQNDAFGLALAAGDFDGDGRDDLAVGSPYEQMGPFIQAGWVNVVYGGSTGLQTFANAQNQFITQDSPGLSSAADVGEHFGFALRAGDFDGDGADDLAISSPRETLPNASYTGVVHVVYGVQGSGLDASASGLAKNQLWHQTHSNIVGPSSIKGTAQAHEKFGHALAAGDANGDGRADLAIFAPGQSALDTEVNVIYGSPPGLAAMPAPPAVENQLWTPWGSYDFNQLGYSPSAAFPEAPTLLGPPFEISDTTPTISWTPVAGAASYEILLYNNGQVVYNNLNTGAPSAWYEPSQALPYSAPNTVYTAYVRAVDANNTPGNYSDALEFRIVTTLAKKTSLSLTQKSPADPLPVIQWQGDPNARSYELLLYDRAAGRLVSGPEIVRGTSFTPPEPLPGGRDYQAFARGINVAGEPGEWSDPLVFHVAETEPLEPPTIIGPDELTGELQPLIAWQQVDGADSYELLMYDKAAGRLIVSLTDVRGTSFRPAEPLQMDRTYQLFVRAVGSHGDPSDWSAPYEFVTTDTTIAELDESFATAVFERDPLTPDL